MIRLILRNLTRRRGRTILTVLGIAVGIAAIITLGAMARAMNAGYTAMLGGSKADLVLSQPNSFDLAYSSVDDDLAEALLAMPEIGGVSGMLQGFVQAEGTPFFFVFGYPSGSFVLERLQIRDGVGLDEKEAGASRGTPLLLGAVAAESLDRVVGDSIRLGDSVYRIVGIFESGDALQDSGAVLSLEDAQTLLGKPRQVSLYYIQLGDTADRLRLETRLARQYPELEVSGTDDFADKQLLDDVLQAYAWGLAGLAIIIGGVGMMNAQLMSVSERTREIGVLRAVGWGRRRVLTMILAESLSLRPAGRADRRAPGGAGAGSRPRSRRAFRLLPGRGLPRSGIPGTGAGVYARCRSRPVSGLPRLPSASGGSAALRGRQWRTCPPAPLRRDGNAESVAAFVAHASHLRRHRPDGRDDHGDGGDSARGDGGND